MNCETGGDFSGLGSPFKTEGITEKWVELKPVDSGYVYHSETGEVPLMIPGRKIRVLHDSRSYVKIIKTDVVDDVNMSGKLIILYVAYHIRIKTKEIQLRWQNVTKWCKFSKASFYRGIEDLKERGIVAVKKDDVYWVNTNVVYNGDRTKA